MIFTVFNQFPDTLIFEHELGEACSKGRIHNYIFNFAVL
jgi:hypothetical protein